MAVAETGGPVRSFERGGKPLLRTRGMIGSRSVYGKTPTRQLLHSSPMAVSGSGHIGKQINHSSRCHSYARQSASQAVLRVTRLTLHATRRTCHGASRLVLAMSAWSVKARRAPSRHCRDARVYGHTTTAMHDSEYTPCRGGVYSGTDWYNASMFCEVYQEWNTACNV